MFEQQPQFLRAKVASLASQAIAQDNPTSWFEPLYAEANGDTTLVPWAKNKAHPYLTEWLATNKIQGNNQSALVIGCGLGDDAEALAKVGYQVTAFDISPTAIAWCQQRFPDSRVSYLVGDLLAANKSWQAKFDLVYECRNIQALPISVRLPVIEAISSFVAKSGILILITRYRETQEVSINPPWALSEQELLKFKYWGIEEISRDEFVEGEQEKIKQLRIELQKL